MRSVLIFKFPSKLSLSEQVSYAKKIVGKYQHEALVLRKEAATIKTLLIRLEKEVEKWKDKYQKSEEELKRSRSENDKLKQEIDRLSKTNSRYAVSLFDHGNFKSPVENGEKREKGGQSGHSDTNRENQPGAESYVTYPRKRIYAKVCADCGSALNRVTSTKQKMLLDIILNPHNVKLIVESERQWCRKCHREVVVKDPQSLPFSEYGLNTFMLVLILRFKGHLSISSISSVFKIAFGLTLSKSAVSNLLKHSAVYLGPKYQELIEAARQGKIVYLDETGWQVKSHPAWLWIMSTEDTADSQGVTVYFAAESRGKGIAKELYGNSQALAMTDGLDSYLKVIALDKHLYCWAHILRFAYEETVNSSPDSRSRWLRDELVRIYHLKLIYPEYTKEQLEDVLRAETNKLLTSTSSDESFLKIKHRLKEQQEGLIKALLVTDSGTNNLAERELRTMVLNKKVSFGSDTYSGMEVSAKLGSVIQTLGRQKVDLLTELTLNLQIGIHQKYPQHHHLSYSDSS